MKKLITILLLFFAVSSYGQGIYELKFDSVIVGKSTSSSFWSKGRVWLRGLTVGTNTDSVVTIRGGKLFKEPRSAFSGGGTVGFANGNLMARYGTGGGFTFSSSANSIIQSNANNDILYASGEVFTADTAGHIWSTRVTQQMKLRQDGTLRIRTLKSGSAAPTNTGTVKMVTTDGLGQLSFDDIPTGNPGTVTSVVSGLGMSFTTITSTGSVAADTTVLRTVANSFTKAQAQPRITLTTTGTSGAATLIGNTLNIPQYTGGGGSGTVTSVSAGLGMSFTTITGSGSVAADTTVLATKANTKTLAQLQTAFDLKASLIGATFSGAVSGTTFTASGGFFDTSDMRLKERVKTKFDTSKINSFSYHFKDNKDGKTHVGYSAQQVRLYMPDAVKTDSMGNLSVNYIEVLVNKVSSLEAKVKKLEARK